MALTARELGIAVLVATLATVLGAVGLVPVVFAERLLPGTQLGGESLSGLPLIDLPVALQEYERSLREQTVTVSLRGQEVTRSLGELGVSIDIQASQAAVTDQPWWNTVQQGLDIVPRLVIDSQALHTVVQDDFALLISLPQNATLEFAASGGLVTVASATGEGIDLTTFEQDIRSRIATQLWYQPIELTIISQPAQVHEGEVERARQQATALLSDGFTLLHGNQRWAIKPFTVRRLLRFVPQVDPANPENYILGVQLDAAGLEDYLNTTLAPEINQVAINARFERSGDRVSQFSLPQQGRELNIPESSKAIAAAVAAGHQTAPLSIAVTDPAVTDVADIEALGVTSLLAEGRSDFVGSPPNRVHNITVGSARYHGLLIPPGEEFSFNEFLGPVTGAAGFKPELVIKNNVTTPEFGGGLCQVSTTAFRAAIYSGLEITERRNHSYAVRYYGTPGFDATIYPGNTDLRFTNNTPSFILIQTRIEGTELVFEFWGTDDGREVTVSGPVPYDRQSNGAVKATLQQTVAKDGNVVIDETFYSRYKSPDLFPRAVATDDPASTN